MLSTHKFLIKGEGKIAAKELPLIFGIAGNARCGKDTLAKYLKRKLQRHRIPVLKISFADEPKKDLDFFLKRKLKISAFTEDSREKNIIRPMLVAYATDVCRNKIDKDFWITKVDSRIQSCIKNKVIVIIPDVRYENELKYIKENGGYIIHITKIGNKPANFEEKVNDPIIKKNADYKIRWKTFTDEKETCFWHLNRLFSKNGWSLYGELN